MLRQNAEKRGVILLSGGLDSSTTLALALADGFDLYALSFDYGQRHSAELQAVQKIVRHYQIQNHDVVKVDPTIFYGSSLVSSHLSIPKQVQQSFSREIPSTYVPARNLIFLSMALAFAESHQIFDIFLGVNKLDHSHYPDCRTQFIEQFEMTANLATDAETRFGKKFKIHTPLINYTKSEIIKLGLKINVDYSLTHSCYSPNEGGVACGLCDACHLRRQAFSENNLIDPIERLDFK